MIEVKGVSKHFDKFLALDQVDLNVKKGSVYGLVGSNGAGKTTLIKHLIGAYRPEQGSIEIGGEPVMENVGLKERVFYVPDDLYFFPMYNLETLGSFYRGVYKAWDRELFERLGEVFPFDAKRSLARLSKGMQKQAYFWLGLCTRPEVMILDEPLDGLDPVMRRKVWSLLLKEVAEREMTVLISSHNLRELEDVCDSVGILHNGKMVLQKELDDAKSSIQKVQAAFSGEVPAEISGLDILHHEAYGSVQLYIVRGEREETTAAFMPYGPILLDVLPLTLEEVFVYELGGLGYEFQSVL